MIWLKIASLVLGIVERLLKQAERDEQRRIGRDQERLRAHEEQDERVTRALAAKRDAIRKLRDGLQHDITGQSAEDTDC